MSKAEGGNRILSPFCTSHHWWYRNSNTKSRKLMIWQVNTNDTSHSVRKWLSITEFANPFKSFVKWKQRIVPHVPRDAPCRHTLRNSNDIVLRRLVEEEILHQILHQRLRIYYHHQTFLIFWACCLVFWLRVSTRVVWWRTGVTGRSCGLESQFFFFLLFLLLIK